MPRLLISLHLPKTAGRSFGLSLRSHFGEALKTDYKDIPIQRSKPRRHMRSTILGLIAKLRLRSKIRCVHGHFLPHKYRCFIPDPDVQFITWLRDPVERLVSHYHYWKRVEPGGKVFPLQAQMIRENWTLERFCLGPEMQNFYGQFLWNFPVERFDFVGITEQYQADFQWFSQHFLHTNLPVIEENVNQTKRTGGYEIEPNLRSQLESHHAEDIVLYEKFRSLSKNRDSSLPRRITAP